MLNSDTHASSGFCSVAATQAISYRYRLGRRRPTWTVEKDHKTRTHYSGFIDWSMETKKKLLIHNHRRQLIEFVKNQLKCFMYI